jgi:hypothetical protein
MATVYNIETEESAWDALRGLLDGRLDPDETIIDFSSAKWAKIHLNYKGDNFHQTVTASMMQGMLEYQYAFYRIIALILRDDPKITRLTGPERDEFELVFRVAEGSSDVEASADDQITKMVTKALGKMTGKQILIGLLSVSLIYFGSQSFANYLDHEVEKSKIESQLKEKNQLYEFLDGVLKEKAENTKLLHDAYNKSEIAKAAGDYNSKAVDEIIRNSGSAEKISIQGISIKNDVIRELTKSSRSRSKDVVIKDMFTVTAVESDDVNNFTVRLERVSTSEVIVAILEDPLLAARHQKAIQTAEWSGRAVMVHLKARQVGDNVRDAKILKAFFPKAKRK